MSEKQIIHKRIWMQYEEPDPDYQVGTGDSDDITWCQDRINASDVEYRLASDYAELEAENRELRTRVEARDKIANAAVARLTEAERLIEWVRFHTMDDTEKQAIDAFLNQKEGTTPAEESNDE